ncbi:MAG TPA: AtpZ/AtpI family protein, partial [Firmicutes bacterium]|nr:AtpZ/AtpI family protein [Bacillota bacterium]
MGRRTNLSIVIGISLIFLTIIPLGMYLGYILDEKLNSSPLLFILFSLASIVFSLYLVYKSWDTLQR